MKKAIWRIGVLLFLLVGTAVTARAQSFQFAAIGDMPYRPADVERFDRLIAELNRRAPAFTVHVGDIKTGSSPCTDEVFRKVKAQFDTFEHPLIYTPGDNEWTDCHRPAAGGWDPIERLALVRTIFFPDLRSLGQRSLPLLRQSAEPAFAKYVENARWTYNDVVFATLHLIGSNNNLQRDRASALEFFERNDANLAWLKSTFAEARTKDRPAVVLAMQADTFFEKHPDERTGFNDFIRALEAEALAYGRPVLLVQGDTHELRVDQPLTVWPSRKRVETILRLTVFGEDHVHAVMVEVDPRDKTSPFAFRPLIVESNIVDPRRR